MSNLTFRFCYRSDTPLIYRAVPSWFIKVEDCKLIIIIFKIKINV